MSESAQVISGAKRPAPNERLLETVDVHGFAEPSSYQSIPCTRRTHFPAPNEVLNIHNTSFESPSKVFITCKIKVLTVCLFGDGSLLIDQHIIIALILFLVKG